MANESVELPMNPEVTKSSGVEISRNSSGKASFGNNDEKVVARYLRTSSSSCHDFCKYAGKHAFESKERHFIPDRATRKQLRRSSEDSVGGTMTSIVNIRASVDSRLSKMSTHKLKEPVDSKSQTSNIFDANKHQNETGNEVLVNKNSSPLVKIKPSLVQKSHVSPTTRLKISSTIKEVKSPKSTCSKVEVTSRSIPKKMKTPSKSTSKVKTSSTATSNTVETSSKLSSLNGKEIKLSEKCVSSLNSSSVTRRQISSMKAPNDFVGKKNSKIKMEKEVIAFSKVASRKFMEPSRTLSFPSPSHERVASVNSRKHKSLKIVSSLKNQQNAKKAEPKDHKNNEVEHEEHNNEVEEKTLYVIKMDSENKMLQYNQKASYDDESYVLKLSPMSSVSSVSQSLSHEDQEETEYAASEIEQDSFSGNLEAEFMENDRTLKVVKKDKPEKDQLVCSEDKDNQMIKLKFKGGKVVANHIVVRTPRRLEFQKAKMLGNKKGDTQKKSFKIRYRACANYDAANGPEKVVLRRQNIHKQKDAQILLNNVIEETASKLVETEKSKVKALVGAFETAISLQEKNPSANEAS
ncbi:hypothetical protein RJT34_28116 [Clitoria ternatea]|uniref:Calmodulin-binding domain-containing protein n=1 Tax=Clitoria ternatea TaxID=43366 RepID=A0AAN9I8V0_CLITE